MRIKLVNGLPVHPTLRHPHTGKALVALMIGKNGKPVWPVMGASEEDGNDADDKPDADDDKKDDGEGNSKDGDDKGKKPEEDSSAAATLQELQEELATVKRRLAAADKNKSVAEKKLAELAKKDLPDADRLKQEAEEAKAQGEKDKKTLRNLAITNAFLLASQKTKINWHDPDVAQDAARKYEGIEVDDEGVVTGMIEAVRKLAKEKSFLVDAGKQTSKDDEDKKNGPSGSGVGTGSGKGKGSGKPDAQELRRKYPSLRN